MYRRGGELKGVPGGSIGSIPCDTRCESVGIYNHIYIIYQVESTGSDWVRWGRGGEEGDKSREGEGFRDLESDRIVDKSGC